MQSPLLEVCNRSVLGYFLRSIHFNFDDIAKLAVELEPTKRNVVSLVGRFYDPLGFISPGFKILFQELCESEVDWDHQLSGVLLSKWQSLVNDLQEGEPI